MREDDIRAELDALNYERSSQGVSTCPVWGLEYLSEGQAHDPESCPWCDQHLNVEVQP